MTVPLTVLPDQHTHLVAQVVKDVWLEEAASPYPDHVLVSLDLPFVSSAPPVKCQWPEGGLTSISIHSRNLASVPLDWTVSIGIQLLPPMKIGLLLILK